MSTPRPPATGWQLRDLPPGDAAWDAGAFEVLRQLRGHLDRDGFDRLHRAAVPQGLRFTAIFGPDGACLGVAGWRVMDTTNMMRKLYVDDLVVDDDARSGGVGSALLDHLVDRARTLGCHSLELDSGHQRVDAHRFYLREGLTDASRHFVVHLDADG